MLIEEKFYCLEALEYPLGVVEAVDAKPDALRLHAQGFQCLTAR